MLNRSWRLARAGLAVMAVGAAACGGGGGQRAAEGAGAPPRPAARRDAPPPPPDPVGVYRQMGLIAHGGAFPLTGRVSYMAGPTSDTTFVVLTLALPSRALTFAHRGDRYQAEYIVAADVRQGTGSAARVDAREQVVVPNFRETIRGDESVLFQQVLRLAPGSYRLALRLQDGASDRAVNDTSVLTVPRLAAGGLATPIPYYEAVVRPELGAVPRLLITPRATVTFGLDSLFPLYVEGYGAGTVAVQAAVRGEGGTIVWRDSLILQPRDSALASAVLSLPVAQLGIGALTVDVWRPGQTDTVHAPVFVNFGEDLPAATFEDMLSYLRFFTSPERLDALRRTPVADRGGAWSAFLAETDPDPALPGHQGLLLYFARIQQANQRYRGEAGPGWLSDRGMVFVGLGDPDQVYEPNPMTMNRRNRLQVWIYRQRQVQLEFRDTNGFDRWELTPGSEAAFRFALRRLHGG